jgi:hypothetical protein
MNEQTINRLAEILGSTGEAIIAQYTTWHLVAALLYILTGLALLYCAWKPAFGKTWEEGVLPAVRVVMLIAGVLFVVCNLPDIFAPKAVAIHQLLQDIAP